MTHDHLRPGKSQGFACVTSLRRVRCRRSGASHQVGTDDSSPEGRRRRARHCGRRSHQKSVHTIHQGEGGGGGTRPLLFSLRQHASLEALQRRMRPTERLMAYLDNIYLVSRPERVGDVVAASVQELWAHARIRGPHHRTGDQSVGDSSGSRGLCQPTFGTDPVEAQKILRRIPTLPDVQSAWLLLLHCASTRANHSLRVVRPEWALEFARAHDQEVWECLCHILTVPTGPESVARASTTLPLAMGGLGLRSAERTRWPACWASWADTLPMIRERHPEVADLIVYHLEGGASSPCVGSACRAATSRRWGGWIRSAFLVSGHCWSTPAHHGSGGQGTWCPTAAVAACNCNQDRVQFRDRNSDAQDESRKTGTMVAFSVCPSSPLTRIYSALFRVLLQRRLHLPLPLSQRICRCGRPLDPFGHHRAACSRTEALGRRGFALESAAARSLQGHVCARHGLGGGLWSSTACRCTEECSWQWTPHSSPLFVAVENQDKEQQPRTVWP